MLRAGAALMVPPAVPAIVRSASAQGGARRLRFGVVADPQYAPVPPRRTRYYAHSLWKVEEAIATFDRHDLAFVVTLGDIIDRHWESFGHILPLYARSKHPNHFVLGNHDYEVAADYLHAVERAVGRKEAHYAFTLPGFRCLVVDGNDVSLFANPAGSDAYEAARAKLAALEAAGAINAKPWNGGMGDAQQAWLADQLAEAEAAGERVVVFGHYPVYPLDRHNMWDDTAFVDMATASPAVVAYFNGHNHAGNYGARDGTHFVNLKGMVETPAETAYAIVEIDDDRLHIQGFGLEATRTLAL
jgi:predicted phosphodiesterase